MEIRKFLYASEWFYELARGIVVFVFILVVLHFFIATVFAVDGASMEPNFHDGEYSVVDKISYFIGEPQRGDVAILRFPGDPEHKKYIKRIIGLPGENLEIKDGEVYINDKKLDEFYLDKNVQTYPNLKSSMGSDEYFFIGDNRNNSSDSRVWGVAPRKHIIGKAWFIIYPLTDFGLVSPVEYSY